MPDLELFQGREVSQGQALCRQCKGDLMQIGAVLRCGTCGLAADAVLAWERPSPVAAAEEEALPEEPPAVLEVTLPPPAGEDPVVAEQRLAAPAKRARRRD